MTLSLLQNINQRLPFSNVPIQLGRIKNKADRRSETLIAQIAGHRKNHGYSSITAVIGGSNQHYSRGVFLACEVNPDRRPLIPRIRQLLSLFNREPVILRAEGSIDQGNCPPHISPSFQGIPAAHTKDLGKFVDAILQLLDFCRHGSEGETWINCIFLRFLPPDPERHAGRKKQESWDSNHGNLPHRIRSCWLPGEPITILICHHHLYPTGLRSPPRRFRRLLRSQAVKRLSGGHLRFHPIDEDRSLPLPRKKKYSLRLHRAG